MKNRIDMLRYAGAAAAAALIFNLSGAGQAAAAVRPITREVNDNLGIDDRGELKKIFWQTFRSQFPDWDAQNIEAIILTPEAQKFDRDFYSKYGGYHDAGGRYILSIEKLAGGGRAVNLEGVTDRRWLGRLRVADPDQPIYRKKLVEDSGLLLMIDDGRVGLFSQNQLGQGGYGGTGFFEVNEEGGVTYEGLLSKWWINDFEYGAEAELVIKTIIGGGLGFDIKELMADAKKFANPQCEGRITIKFDSEGQPTEFMSVDGLGLAGDLLSSVNK